ncbi:hypothetical protein CEP52_010087 [Fusarium oligoseptatum]|uniref:DUF2293 domain-containing protein n=1 Tax=Fusarium oligoseptatum TaxID=2604345 RepID=A0A428T9W7_9HYPO|nr:hypothetical protein CEP52_010087 [Fusarium oligoseptatum]
MGGGKPLGKVVCISAADKLPSGYSRLEQGNAYLTSNCRKQATEQKKDYYQWQEKGRQIMAFPTSILKAVKQADRRTKPKRLRAVAKSDKKLRQEFLTTTRTSYPGMPREERTKLAKVQMEKGQNRIARSRKLPMEKRVEVAVWAHAWHVQEREGKRAVEILREWQGKTKKI